MATLSEWEIPVPNTVYCHSYYMPSLELNSEAGTISKTPFSPKKSPRLTEEPGQRQNISNTQ